MRHFLIAIITLPHPEQRAKRAFVEGRATGIAGWRRFGDNGRSGEATREAATVAAQEEAPCAISTR
jgi:hypothetical protein